MKKSLIETLLTETTPDDYLRREADELQGRKEKRVSEPLKSASKGTLPELTFLAMMAGFAGIMIGAAYLLIF
ncbi:hypothetical protein RRU94_12355 [Domibacillus sp. DTU_2020_1001157_1_SI_ALB_TIR_016]|uniref:hypothetical protein n=1 Tax=Domibacillus sp. DTU_2020_1001157_1_SI_ALB_TIR_016 TaxID=3077789 RepID=UPI0028EF19BA|nr:hypothetical protein [Domibacillus sp. DTU_2020_1001157_1_SI_ALB_TIR_016]WNS81579.1 hypothetical protein RRU94_12355 [Domibacillus sp. DTU_2020_1001157_1_SI_ALB_TIR_016]